MEEGKYIYSIIQENKDRRFGWVGINSREVSILPYKDIAAVVSDTPIMNFDSLDKKELTEYVAVHQKINEEVVKRYDAVPMAFGIIAPSVGEVESILEKAYLQFKSALEKIEGKVEFAVQVWWDKTKFLEELANADSEIQKLKQIMFSKLSILGLPIKLKLGKLIHQKVEVQKEIYIKDIQRFLGGLSYDYTLNKLIEDDMLVNFSFLIKRSKESELDRKMEELGKKYNGTLRFKYIGPMPSYSFVNINLSLGNFEVVNKARKFLGLGEEVAFNEIKNAYYALARQYHPDKHPDNPEKVQEQMKEITAAYNILENYCQSCDESMGIAEGRKYSFKENDVKNALIVREKSQRFSTLS